ncbi:MAG: 2,3-bisphosphoglycerate-independent phosphoglycerate mutase [Bacteroidota bacterium]|jgi:2,3-bisphosphoglycerate-independent phosphoglycerate mutase
MKKVLLVILDGWGLGDKSKADAIYQAHTPVMDDLSATFPMSRLRTHGTQVGLPEGQMGNSEVGHLNIGAGRVVFQDLERINRAISSGEMMHHPVLKQAFDTARQNRKSLHFIGLVSDGGVHASLDHIKFLCKAAANHQIPEIFVHAITDGRDTDPKSGAGYLASLEKDCKGTPVKIASIIGRYYAMDRDNRWERIKLAYDLYVHGKGSVAQSCEDVFKQTYEAGITDEFILPHLLTGAFKPIAEGDVVICFNFRTDRCREITMALTQQPFPEQEMNPLNLNYYTMTNYDEGFRNVKVLFNKDNLENTLGEIVSKNNLSQLRIAETEKYPHVTFFFSGGREQAFPGESRILIPSPKVATYDLLPEMSAHEITDAAVQALEKNAPDFVCINYANADMVGHTGVYSAIVSAVETVDTCLGKLLLVAKEKNYAVLVIADHGNADVALNEDGTPNTAHTLNPVPCILLFTNYERLSNGTLADVAPTILKLMNIEQPKEMDGKSLI